MVKESRGYFLTFSIIWFGGGSKNVERVEASIVHYLYLYQINHIYSIIQKDNQLQSVPFSLNWFALFRAASFEQLMFNSACAWLLYLVSVTWGVKFISIFRVDATV